MEEHRQDNADRGIDRAAGAREVLISSARRRALLHETLAEAEPPLDDLLARLSPAEKWRTRQDSNL
jgi:molybdopterin-guanine dinucleotide biosynthesis adapter protein